MSRSNEDQAIPGAGGLFDWDEFQNGFFGGGGWKEAWSANPHGTIPWVDRYVKGILADAVPGAVQKASGQAGPPPSFAAKHSAVACNVFETHRSIIVRIRLAAAVEPRRVHLRASPYELIVSGLPGEEDKPVKLPVAVRVDEAKAICKQRILEVTFPKEDDVPAKDIPVRFMEGG